MINMVKKKSIFKYRSFPRRINRQIMNIILEKKNIHNSRLKQQC